MVKLDMMQISFFVCIGVAVLLFIVSIVLFVKFDIRSILAARSVRKNAPADSMMEAAEAPVAAPRPQRPFGRRRTAPEEGAERTVVLHPSDGVSGKEMTAVLPPINELTGQDGEFTIVKKVICSDSAETIV